MKKLYRLDKKGQLSVLAPSIITLVIAAVFLILGLVVIQETRDTDVVTQAIQSTVTNETINFTNGRDVAKVGDRGANSFSLLNLTNATSGVMIPTTNYSLSPAGKLTTHLGFFNSTNVKITYSYKHGDESYDTANKTLTGISNFSDYWELIVLAIVITIVIGLLLTIFANRGGR